MKKIIKIIGKINEEIYEEFDLFFFKLIIMTSMIIPFPTIIVFLFYWDIYSKIVIMFLFLIILLNSYFINLYERFKKNNIL